MFDRDVAEKFPGAQIIGALANDTLEASVLMYRLRDRSLPYFQQNTSGGKSPLRDRRLLQ